MQEAQEPVACQNPREEWERSVVEIVESGREDVRRKKRGRIAEWRRRVRVDSRVDKKSTGREEETQRRKKDRERESQRTSRVEQNMLLQTKKGGDRWRRMEKRRREEEEEEEDKVGGKKNQTGRRK